MKRLLMLVLACGLTMGALGATRAGAAVTTPANGRGSIMGRPSCSPTEHRIAATGWITMENGYSTQAVRFRMWVYSYATKSWSTAPWATTQVRQGPMFEAPWQAQFKTPAGGMTQYFVVIEYNWGRVDGSWLSKLDSVYNYNQELADAPGFYFQYGQCWA